MVPRQTSTTGVVIMLPAFAEDDRVFEYHLAAVRSEVDNFGLAKPSVFAAKLQKAAGTDAAEQNSMSRFLCDVPFFLCICVSYLPIAYSRCSSPCRQPSKMFRSASETLGICR